ncbi:MAG: hypothetical protein KAQ79_13830, partial [Cyclobacteriaceae bacterium]|nr:hypothetical protein [Cyclobacteriaceae bacterium]
NLKRSLWYGVKDISSELFGSARNGQLRKDEFWAVDDVSLSAVAGLAFGNRKSYLMVLIFVYCKI